MSIYSRVLIGYYLKGHHRPQRPYGLLAAIRIESQGRLNFQSIQRVMVSYSKPIRFVRLDSEHAQSDGKSVNCRLPEGVRPLGTPENGIRGKGCDIWFYLAFHFTSKERFIAGNQN